MTFRDLGEKANFTIAIAILENPLGPTFSSVAQNFNFLKFGVVRPMYTHLRHKFPPFGDLDGRMNATIAIGISTNPCSPAD